MGLGPWSAPPSSFLPSLFATLPTDSRYPHNTDTYLPLPSHFHPFTSLSTSLSTFHTATQQCCSPLQSTQQPAEGARAVWSLLKRTLIIGDSNLPHPPFTDPHLQLDSFPGAKFHHITPIFNKLRPCHNTSQVIISVGLNNGLSDTAPSSSLKQLQEQSTLCFPNATIYIPIINFSYSLNIHQQTALTTLNNTIASKYNFIPEINPLFFQVTSHYNIHWTMQTAEMFLKQVQRHLRPAVRPYPRPPHHNLLGSLSNLLGKLKANFEGARGDCDALRPCRLISAYRRNKNLQDLLVQTNLNKSTKTREAPRVSEVDFIRLLHVFNPFSREGKCEVCVLESSSGWSTGQRRAAERRWIHRLCTIDPGGLNEKN
ncbi:hypothetical protein F7725_012188 [Dissostichus mawsoni]|uniref:Uncharacterized protein n=1 Tax=Dissostichus mawsoni TaxID=36200 RepID=A0A7J5YLN9_DISMA|nr:hypothetical protein F7725_012188 [Dissostichus mawsoni]